MIPSHKQVQSWDKHQYSYTPETCWIAHGKEISGPPIKEAPNRIRSKRANPTLPINLLRSGRFSVVWNVPITLG
jgi:hypothetical protein